MLDTCRWSVTCKHRIDNPVRCWGKDLDWCDACVSPAVRDLDWCDACVSSAVRFQKYLVLFTNPTTLSKSHFVDIDISMLFFTLCCLKYFYVSIINGNNN